jgi:hypothetical protein
MKLSKIIVAASIAVMVAMLSGCYVTPGPVYGPGAWVPGHYGPYGGWHPGHYVY